MAVSIRMKKMGRTHRAFFRICAIDKREPRGGRVLEELGTYDPSVPDTDARARLDGERVAYWVGVGAQPSEKVAVLIKKYGKDGTHLEKQQAAISKLSQPKSLTPVGPAVKSARQIKEEAAAEAAAAAAAEAAAAATAAAAEASAAAAASAPSAEVAAEESAG